MRDLIGARLGLLLLVALAIPSRSDADVVLLLGEPYGRLGSLSPTGHAAVYLTRICTESPTLLRRCQFGETGVVISRYHRVAGLDWLAIPLIPYLYAVDRADQVPQTADAAAVASLRDAYRRAQLSDLIPDTSDGEPPKGDWIQLVGAAYDRKIVAFTTKTTTTQDDELIRILNARDNESRFNFLFRNCADFARDIINLYYPKALRSSFFADFGLTTPKHIAKSLVQYSARRPDIELSAFIISQIPGSRRESRNARGVLESLVKTKKYAIPLAVVQPWLPTTFAASYLVNGRFNPERYATDVYSPAELEQHASLSTLADEEAPSPEPVQTNALSCCG
jgi:hypothetical protein